MTGPQDPAAAGGDRLRAGHADREQVIEALKDAFVQAGSPGANSTRGWPSCWRRAPTRSWPRSPPIPPAPAAAGPARPPTPARRWPLVRAAAGSGGCLVIAAAAFWGATILDPGPPAPSPDHYWAPLMLLIACCRSRGGTRHPGERGGHLMGAETLPQAAAAPAGAGRPRPGRRTARRHGPWPGSPAPAPTRPAPTCGLTSHRSTGSTFPPGRAGHPVAWDRSQARYDVGETSTGTGLRLSRLGLTS